MRAKIHLVAIIFTALLLSGCLTHKLHSEMDSAFPRHKSVETTETLNYMGLNGKKELVLITDKHHFVLSPDKEIIRTHQEQIFTLLNK